MGQLPPILPVSIRPASPLITDKVAVVVKSRVAGRDR